MRFNGLAAQQLECLDYRRPPRDAGWQPPLLRRVLVRFDQRRRCAIDSRVAGGPQIRASASGSHSRAAPQRRVMRTWKCPTASRTRPRALAPRTDATRWRYERLFLERLFRVPEKLA